MLKEHLKNRTMSQERLTYKLGQEVGLNNLLWIERMPVTETGRRSLKAIFYCSEGAANCKGFFVAGIAAVRIGSTKSCGCKRGQKKRKKHEYMSLLNEKGSRYIADSLESVQGKQRKAWVTCPFNLSDCLKEYQANIQSVIRGESTSCGCFNSRVTHGAFLIPDNRVFLKTYYAMLDRCYNPKNANYHRYGGRLISVCEEWRKDVLKFIADVKPTWSEGLTLDRIDNDEGYTLRNVRWASRKEQSNNLGNNLVIEYLGQRKTCAQWAVHLNISRSSLSKRINRGQEGSFAISSMLNRKGKTC